MTAGSAGCGPLTDRDDAASVPVALDLVTIVDFFSRNALSWTLKSSLGTVFCLEGSILYNQSAISVSLSCSSRAEAGWAGGLVGSIKRLFRLRRWLSSLKIV